MSQPLFRTEVLQARRQPWLGAVSLDQPPAARWLAALAALACIGVALGLMQSEYTGARFRSLWSGLTGAVGEDLRIA